MNEQIKGVPECDVFDIGDDGRIYLHMMEDMTPEQLQLIVDYAKAKRSEHKDDK